MFDNVSYKYDRTKNTYTFSGWVGTRFKYAIAKMGYSLDKQKYLFEDLGWRGFTVNRFFLVDIRHICAGILAKGNYYGVNYPVIRKIHNIINDEIFSNDTSSTRYDYDLIKVYMKYMPLRGQEPVYDAYLRTHGIPGSRGSLLKGAIGSGKTYISLSLALALHSEITLIVAPLPTISKVWTSSLAGDGLLFKTPQEYHLVGSGDEYRGEKYVIVHYENLRYILGLFKKYNINFSTIIVDEVHNFTDSKSTRTKQLVEIVSKIPFKHAIPMSGTPIKAVAKELIPLLAIISEDFDYTIMKRFSKLYRGRSKVMEAVLKTRYEDYTITVTKDSMDIPPITTTTVKLKGDYRYTLVAIRKRMREYIERREKELTNDYGIYKETYQTLYARAKAKLVNVSVEEFRRYEKVINIIIRNYDNNNLSNIPDEMKEANVFEKKYIEPALEGLDRKQFREAKTVYKYLRLKVQGEALANVVMKARIDCYTELAEKSGSVKAFINGAAKKTIVFSNYIQVCDAVKKTCDDIGYSPVTVYGPTTKDLTKNVNIFTNTEKTNPLITTYKSLSTGVPLIVANAIMIYGLPHRQYIFDQAVGRAWRTGQDSPVAVYIVELDTGDEPNITDRDFDIIDFFRKEVARFTGSDDSVAIERSPEVQVDLGIHGFLDTNDSYLTRAIKGMGDIVTGWR